MKLLIVCFCTYSFYELKKRQKKKENNDINKKKTNKMENT